LTLIEIKSLYIDDIYGLYRLNTTKKPLKISSVAIKISYLTTLLIFFRIHPDSKESTFRDLFKHK